MIQVFKVGKYWYEGNKETLYQSWLHSGTRLTFAEWLFNRNRVKYRESKEKLIAIKKRKK